MAALRKDGRVGAAWWEALDLQRIVAEVGTPLFVNSEAQLIRNVQRIRDAGRTAGLRHPMRLYPPLFPNSNPLTVHCFQELGVGSLVQLPNELELLQRFGFDDFIVSPGHISDEDVAFWSKTGYRVFLSSLDEVKAAVDLGAPAVCVRVDGLDSTKPGIKAAELPALVRLLERADVRLDSYEVYWGSGNSLEQMLEGAERTFGMFNQYFPMAASIDFAGGHGFSYDDGDDEQKHFGWLRYFTALTALAKRAEIPENVEFLFEPARDILADVGVLVLEVARDVIRGRETNLVVVNGSRMLMPSAQLRDRRHHTRFLDRSGQLVDDEGPGVRAAIRGCTVLRNDYVLPGEDYWVPDGVGAGCYLVISDVGAYCATQHMEFLNVPPAPEVLVDPSGVAHLVTARGPDLDKWRHLQTERKPLVNMMKGGGE
jgi:diaminopimelate decarboxylase